MNKYTLSFIDDFDDMINENFFKSRLRKTLKNQKIDEQSYSLFGKISLQEPKSLPNLSDVLFEYKDQRKYLLTLNNYIQLKSLYHL